MRASRFLHGVVVAGGVLVAGVATAGSARAQSDAELEALDRQVQQLHRAGKYAEAIPIAEQYVAAASKRHGEEHPNYATAIGQLAQLLQATDRLAEAEPLMRRALSIDEKSLGPEHPDVAIALNNLAALLLATNGLAEAEPLMRRALSIDEKGLGPEHPNVAKDLNNLAQLLQATNRLADAEPLMRRVITILEKSLGPDHPEVAAAFNNLGRLLQVTNRLADAEPLYRRALSIDEKSLGPEHPDVGIHLNNLALLLQDTNRLAEAEPLMRRVISVFEKSLGPDHPNVATALNNLGWLLHATNRLAEAEPIYRRALSIDEKSLGPEHPDVGIPLNNLARLLQDTNRPAEAEPLMRRVITIFEKSLGPDHPNVATALNNLAQLEQDTNRLAEAEPLFRRTLSIVEKSWGREHPSVAIALNNLAQLLQATNRFAEAEALYRRGLSIAERSLGPEHPDVANHLRGLALLRAELGDWAEAVQLYGRAKPIMIAAHSRGEGGDRSGLAKAALTANTGALRASARAAYHANAGGAEAREEGFELAQWALQTGAADALSQMSVRFAKGGGKLAALVRQRQDLIARRQGEDRRLLAAVGAADAKAAETLRAAMAAMDNGLNAIDKELTTKFPEYADLSDPKPVTIRATQALLKLNEALVLFLDVPQFGNLPEETLAWVVTKEAVRWGSIPLGTRALSDRVAALRCGLDASSWDSTWGWPDTSDLDKQRIREQQARQQRCEALVKAKPSTELIGLVPVLVLPFDLTGAHELYQALLAPFVDLTRGKHLIIVPSGPLTNLPFQVLVTQPADPAPTGTARYRIAPWLALQQAVTVLPSVGSLQALRKLEPSRAAEPYIAFGNPLLLGAHGTDKSAWAKQRCMQPGTTRMAQVRGGARLGVSLRAIDLAELRTQQPLPETADELCAVARALGALGRGADTVWLGERATERNVKALSRDGTLAHYKVVHFATHGVLAGESEAILKARAEPALILTPPRDGVTAAELEEDDGLLMASEVAQLELDADWVVLSACNTAAGEKGDAEALSGLARAFFYAKARALLVSHWYVNSDAAVKLTTRAFAAFKADPKIGRAESLRISMVQMITKGHPKEAHPANWAPFALVGEGAR